METRIKTIKNKGIQKEIELKYPIETKIGIDIIGKKAKYIKMSKVKGEQYFKDNGFKQQLNKNYWKKQCQDI